MADLTRCLRRALAAADPEPDADLVGRFAADRDEAAFAALVRRHGPMVLAVCRRVLRDHHAAEDAFQATFLVLARRAAVLRPRAAVGNWLYGVAYRTALAARRGLLLAKRLKKFGLAVPAAGLGAVTVPAAVAAQLTTTTARLGALAAAGEVVVPAAVAALTEGAMKAILLTKLKVLTAALVVGCAVLASVAAGWRANATAAGAGDPPPADKKAKTVAPPKAGQNKDKDRIAELERERDRLLKELAEARYRMALLEARQAELLAVMRRAELDRAKAEARATKVVPAIPAAPPTASVPAGSPALGTTPSAPAPPNTAFPVPPASRPAPAVARPPKAEAPDLPPLPPLGVSDDPAASPPGVSAPPLPQPGQAGPAPPRPRPTVHVYPVGDLAADEKEGEALCKVVRAAVDPKSWGADAGVEFLPGKKVLVVRQTAEGHEQVAGLLHQLMKHETPAGRK